MAAAPERQAAKDLFAAEDAIEGLEPVRGRPGIKIQGVELMEPMDFPAERGAVVETATRYYGTMVAGDEAVLRQLFENRAPIVGYYQNEFLWLTLNDVIDETKSLIGQHGEEECSVESVRIDGDMATVAKRDRYAGAWFLDHLSIFQVNDRWTIAGKSFHVLA